VASKLLKYHSVNIDGVKYIPAIERPLEQEAIKLLSEVYGRLWTEAYYDPMNESTRKFSKPLSDKMSKLNKLLKFKE